jgi:hypothetical protein
MRGASSRLAILVLIALSGCKGSITIEEVEVSLSPLSGAQGQTLTLFVTGIGTSFEADNPETEEYDVDPAVNLVGESGGLVLRRVTVDNPHRARVSLAITPDAPVTGRDVEPARIRVETSGETFEFDFEVLSLSSLPGVVLEPDSGLAGISGLVVDVSPQEGTTLFDEGTVVSFPEFSGVTVSDTSYLAPTGHVKVTITIDDEAAEQSFPVTVTTGSDVATHPFRVISGEGGPRLTLSPSEAQRGSSVEVGLVVSGGDVEMTLDPSDMELRFPYNPQITVESLEYLDPTTASATLLVGEDAPLGSFQAILESGGSIAKGTFRVLPAAGTDPFLRLFPSVVEQGVDNQLLSIFGVYTSFSIESEVVIVPGDGIDVESFLVLNAVEAVATLSVATDAPLDTSVFKVTTEGEVASAGITVIEPMSLRVNVVPEEVQQGADHFPLSLEVVGADLLAATTISVTFPDESGVSLTRLDVPSSTKVDISVDVDSTAPTGVSMLTLSVDGQLATAHLVITPSTGGTSMTIDPPFFSIPSGEVSITLKGTGTSWSSGVHELLFSEPSIEIVDFRVDGPTTAVATVVGPAWIQDRRAVAWIVSPSDIVGAWWMLLPPGYRKMELNPVPAEVERGSTGNLFLAQGESTGFVDGLTSAYTPPGSGLRVSRVDVDNPELAIVEVDVSTDAPVGVYGLTLSTGGETALASISVLEATSPKTASLTSSVVPFSAVEAGTWNNIDIDGVGTTFTSTVTTVRAPAPEYETDLGLRPPPTVRDVSTLDVDMWPDPSITGYTMPIEVKTDLEVVRACVSVVANPLTDPFPVLDPLVLTAGQETTLEVTASGTSPPDFTSDTPSVTSLTAGVTVLDVTVDSTTVAWVQLDVADDVTSPVLLRFQHGTAYDWWFVLPALPTPPAIMLTGSPTLVCGTCDGLLQVQSSGFMFDPASLRSASPGRVMFVDSTTSTGARSAEVHYDTAISEVAESVSLYLMPEASPWSMPLRIDLAAADVNLVGIPSSVFETIPTEGPDYLGFTPGTGSRLGLWSVLGGDVTGPPWRIVGSDGISVMSRSDGTRVAALIDPALERHYVSLGEAAHAGSSYWAGLDDVLPGITHFEAEPNDSFLGAEGLAGPGLDAVLASVDGPGDVDFFQLTYSGSAPACYEAVSARWIAGAFTSPYLAMSLLDDVGRDVRSIVGGDGFETMDPILCTDGAASGYRIVVSGLAGTTGPYLLLPRWPIIVSEVDHTAPFVEVSGPPGTDLAAYRVQILDASSGAERGSVSLASLGTMPADGHVVVASPGAVSGADIESAIMDLMTVPYVARVCHTGHLTCDAVQVGGSTGGFGEGAVVDVADMPAGRLWGIDSNDNAADFRKLVTDTPGGANALPVP